jgi:hypothetical protein
LLLGDGMEKPHPLCMIVMAAMIFIMQDLRTYACEF